MAASLVALRPAFARFYDLLNDEQKAPSLRAFKATGQREAEHKCDDGDR